MTTTNSHAAPWTVRRFLACLLGSPRSRVKFTEVSPILTGREATARHLYGEAVHWSRLDMAEYDTSPMLRGGWLAEADRRIATPTLSLMDLMISRWHGYTPQQWAQLPAIVQVDKRESYFQVQGLGS